MEKHPLPLLMVFVATGVFCVMETITSLLKLLFCLGPAVEHCICIDYEGAGCASDRIAMTILAGTSFAASVVLVYVVYSICCGGRRVGLAAQTTTINE